MLGSSADGVTGTNTVMGNVDIISSDPGKLISALCNNVQGTASSNSPVVPHACITSSISSSVQRLIL
ncbi:hypothetical protein D5086_027352 [Populus alba]|uniref:Uncharacterized protein n=1 Tax=Populus alba TaxID=43335 RepID=A0ACC4AV22_POPAL